MKTKDLFHFRGYDIPVNLVGRTGGGTESFEKISDWHISQVQKYIGIKDSDNILEIGCGIGRDAIPLTRLLRSGKYIGTDTIAPSIEWCRENISPRYPNFQFIHHDIHDTLHNPTGTLNALDIKLPPDDHSIDIVLLHSVFTHMFADEVLHYLREFHRVLKPTGKVWASFFIVDETILSSIQENANPGWNLTFRQAHETGCYINSTKEPRQSVAYDELELRKIVDRSELELDQPIIWGNWSGFRTEPKSGQDALVLRQKLDS